VLSLFHLWRASTLNGIPPWIEPVPGLSAMALDSILAVLFSGIHLTIQLAWIDVTMGAFFLMAPLGAVTGKRLRVIRHLRRKCSDESSKTSRPAAAAFSQDFAGYQNRGLSRNCPADDGKTERTGIAQHRRCLRFSWIRCSIPHSKRRV